MSASITSKPNLHPSAWSNVDGRIRAGVWRDEVMARATHLRSDARWLVLRAEVRPEALGAPIDVEVFQPLDRVEALAARGRATFREWLSGSQVEECWRLLRQAEEGLLHLVADGSVPTRAKQARAHGLRMLGSDDPLRVVLDEALGGSAPPAALRAIALDVVRASHEASDRQHRQLRSFRNQLLGLSVVLVALGAILLVVQSAMEQDLIPVPQGLGMSATGMLAVVMFFGCVGALFSAVPSLAAMPETSSPFNLPRQQAVLKVVMGAWSAVIGLLVVNAGLAAGAADTSSLGGLMVVAALFGAGQEAVTRFADQKAGTLLGNA